MLEVLRLADVDRVVLQRPLCESTESCEVSGLDTFYRWYRGYYVAAITAFRPNATLYWRSHEDEKMMIPLATSNFAENSTLLMLQNEMCMENAVIRLNKDVSLYRSIKRSTTRLFRKAAYAMSGVAMPTKAIGTIADGQIVITIAYREKEMSFVWQNAHKIARGMMVFPKAIVVEGTTALSLASSDGFLIRLIDVANRTQLGFFEDFVRVCSQSHVIIADHSSFLANIILMREETLFVTLSEDLYSSERVGFERLADVFSIYFKNLAVSDDIEVTVRTTVADFLCDVHNFTYLKPFATPDAKNDSSAEVPLPNTSQPFIVYMNFGQPPAFMLFIEELARRGSSVVVISDFYTSRIVSPSSGGSTYLIYEPMSPYIFGTDYFRKVYKHLHKDQSAFKYRYELNCFLRWITLRNFMRVHGLNAVVMADTDSAIFVPSMELFSTRSQCDAVLSVQASDHWTQWVKFRFMNTSIAFECVLNHNFNVQGGQWTYFAVEASCSRGILVLLAVIPYSFCLLYKYLKLFYF